MSNVMELLNRPEALTSPEYPKLALQAAKRELLALQYELNYVVDKQELIVELEAQSSLMENIRNERLELIPKLPF